MLESRPESTPTTSQMEQEEVNWSESRPQAQTPTQTKAEASTQRAEDQLVQAAAALAAALDQEQRTTVIEMKHRMRVEGSSKTERLAKMTEGAAVIACFTLNAPIQSCWEVALSLRTTEDQRGTTSNGSRQHIEWKAGQQAVVNMFTADKGAMVGARVEIAVLKETRAILELELKEIQTQLQAQTGRQQLK